MDARDLNQKQRKAVAANDGPVLIVAGPGTGKTKTLTAHIAYLMQQGVEPDAILALTFTVKAANEMRDRVVALASGVRPHISTFHALGYKLLREALPDDRLTFISESDRLTLVRELSRPKELGSLSTRELALAVSRYKGSVMPNQSLPLGQLVAQYQRRLQDANLVDFDDLLFRTFQLFEQNTAMRDKWRLRYRHILMDEFQDTSELQWELIQKLRGNDNVFVIGDPKQSIYGFRGADVDMFLNEFSEADYVLAQIEKGIGGSDLLKAGGDATHSSFRDFAVLYRTHQAAKTVQQRLLDSGIPFQVVGEGSPFEQLEVQAVIGLLQRLEGGDAAPPRGFSSIQADTLLQQIDTTQPVSSIAEACIRNFSLASDDRKRQRLAQFVSTLVRFDTSSDGLQKCLAYIDRISQEEFYDPDADAVTLMTIHASKGLEFTHVMLIATEEGILPHVRKTAATDFEEERRLFYVAITRAKQQLDVIYAKKRAKEQRQPSRYITELDAHVLPRLTDPAMDKLEKKLHRREQKVRQGRLF